MSRTLKAVAIVIAFVAIFVLSRHVIGSRATPTTTTTAVTTTTSVTPSTLVSTSCAPNDFTGIYNEGQGAAGTIYASVTLTKTTAGTCTLSGWPQLTLQDRLGGLVTIKQVNVPAKGVGFTFLTAQANQTPTSLSLDAQSTTSFALAYSDVPTGTASCPSAVNLSVQFKVAGASIPITAPYAVSPCNGGQIWVSPFY